MFCLCILRVFLCVYLCCLSMIHTVYTAPFPHLHARKHMLTASVSVADRRKKEHKYTLVLYYVVCVDLRRNNGSINVICAFLHSFQRQFACFVPLM